MCHTKPYAIVLRTSVSLQLPNRLDCFAHTVNPVCTIDRPLTLVSEGVPLSCRLQIQVPMISLPSTTNSYSPENRREHTHSCKSVLSHCQILLTCFYLPVVTEIK